MGITHTTHWIAVDTLIWRFIIHFCWRIIHHIVSIHTRNCHTGPNLLCTSTLEHYGVRSLVGTLWIDITWTVHWASLPDFFRPSDIPPDPVIESIREYPECTCSRDVHKGDRKLRSMHLAIIGILAGVGITVIKSADGPRRFIFSSSGYYRVRKRSISSVLSRTSEPEGQSATHAKPIVKHPPRVSDSRVSGGRLHRPMRCSVYAVWI